MKNQSRQHEEESKEIPVEAEGADFASQTPQMPQNPTLEDLEAAALTKERVFKYLHEECRKPPIGPEREEWESTKAKKRIFLDIFGKTMGTITVACEKAGIDRKTYYRWKAQDDNFAQALVDIENDRTSMVEDRLFKLIQSDDGPSIRFYLERLSARYKAKQLLEHHTDDITFEEVADQLWEKFQKQHESNQQSK